MKKRHVVVRLTVPVVVEIDEAPSAVEAVERLNEFGCIDNIIKRAADRVEKEREAMTGYCFCPTNARAEYVRDATPAEVRWWGHLGDEDEDEDEEEWSCPRLPSDD